MDRKELSKHEVSNFCKIDRLAFLNHEICEEFHTSNKYATKQAIVLRILMKWMDTLDYPIENLYDLTNLAKIDRDCMINIYEMWQESLCRITATQDEITNLERLMSKDYAKSYDIARYLSGLSKRFRNRDVLKLLAIDGLLGVDFKNYVVNLKFSLYSKERPTSYEEVHVRAIREIYNRFSDLEPEELSEILLDVYDEKESDSNVAQMYLESVNGYLANIANWKKEQISKEEKKNKSSEAKKPSDDEIVNKPKKQKPKDTNKTKNVNKVSNNEIENKSKSKKRKVDAEVKQTNNSQDNGEIIENQSKNKKQKSNGDVKKAKNSKNNEDEKKFKNKKRKSDICDESGDEKEIIKKSFKNKKPKSDVCNESGDEEEKTIEMRSWKRKIDVCDDSIDEEEIIETKSKKHKIDVCDESEDENKSDESGEEEEMTENTPDIEKKETVEESEIECEDSDIDA